MRKYSLDELLNFWSVVKGDMSIIGPRPMPEFFVERMSERHKMRHAVRPCLECPHTVPEDSPLSKYHWTFENDIWYIEHISFITDVQMVLAIVKAALKGSEYRASDTRTPFDGTNLDETRGRDELGIEKHFESLEK